MSDKYIEISVFFITANAILPIILLMIFDSGRPSTEGFLKDFKAAWFGMWAFILIVGGAVAAVGGFIWSGERLFF